MNLVIHQVQQLQDVDVADGDLARNRLSGSTVKQVGLSVGIHQVQAIGRRARRLQNRGQFILARPVKDRGGNARSWLHGLDFLGQICHPWIGRVDFPAGGGRPAQVCLQNLPDVHAAGNTERVEHDVDRRSVARRHVFDRQDLGDHTLVAMTAGEFVAFGDLPLLRDIHPHEAIAGGSSSFIDVEDANIDDLAGLTVRHFQ